jgi:hypothetical protein
VTKVALGLSDPAGRNASEAEQASTVTMRMPTLLRFGEGRVSGEAIDARASSIRYGEDILRHAYALARCKSKTPTSGNQPKAAVFASFCDFGL